MRGKRSCQQYVQTVLEAPGRVTGATEVDQVKMIVYSAPVSMPLTGFSVSDCAYSNSFTVMGAGRNTSAWTIGGRT